MVTDGHETQAVAALRSKRHGRIRRFFLELVGWPIGQPLMQAEHPGPSHLRAVHHEHRNDSLDAACGARSARHRTERAPPLNE